MAKNFINIANKIIIVRVIAHAESKRDLKTTQ